MTFRAVPACYGRQPPQFGQVVPSGSFFLVPASHEEATAVQCLPAACWQESALAIPSFGMARRLHMADKQQQQQVLLQGPFLASDTLSAAQLLDTADVSQVVFPTTPEQSDQVASVQLTARTNNRIATAAKAAQGTAGRSTAAMRPAAVGSGFDIYERLPHGVLPSMQEQWQHTLSKGAGRAVCPRSSLSLHGVQSSSRAAGGSQAITSLPFQHALNPGGSAACDASRVLGTSQGAVLYSTPGALLALEQQLQPAKLALGPNSQWQPLHRQAPLRLLDQQQLLLSQSAGLVPVRQLYQAPIPGQLEQQQELPKRGQLVAVGGLTNRHGRCRPSTLMLAQAAAAPGTVPAAPTASAATDVASRAVAVGLQLQGNYSSGLSGLLPANKGTAGPMACSKTAGLTADCVMAAQHQQVPHSQQLNMLAAQAAAEPLPAELPRPEPEVQLHSSSSGAASAGWRDAAPRKRKQPADQEPTAMAYAVPAGAYAAASTVGRDAHKAASRDVPCAAAAAGAKKPCWATALQPADHPAGGPSAGMASSAAPADEITGRPAGPPSGTIADLLGVESCEEAAARLARMSRAELYAFASQAVGQVRFGQQSVAGQGPSSNASANVTSSAGPCAESQQQGLSVAVARPWLLGLKAASAAAASGGSLGVSTGSSASSYSSQAGGLAGQLAGYALDAFYSLPMTATEAAAAAEAAAEAMVAAAAASAAAVLSDVRPAKCSTVSVYRVNSSSGMDEIAIGMQPAEKTNAGGAAQEQPPGSEVQLTGAVQGVVAQGPQDPGSRSGVPRLEVPEPVGRAQEGSRQGLAGTGSSPATMSVEAAVSEFCEELLGSGAGQVLCSGSSFQALSGQDAAYWDPQDFFVE